MGSYPTYGYVPVSLEVKDGSASRRMWKIMYSEGRRSSSESYYLICGPTRDRSTTGLLNGSAEEIRMVLDAEDT